MIGNNTPASPQANAGIKEITFFSAVSVSNISSTFQVNTEPFYLRAFNLATGDTVTVQSVDGPGSGTVFSNFQPLGAPIQLTPAQPQVRIDWPGRYRLVFAGTSVSAITVVGNEAAFGAQSIYGASATSGGGGSGFALTPLDSLTVNLTFIGNTAGGTLQADVNEFALPKTSPSLWDLTVPSARGLQTILYVLDTPSQITNVGVGAGGQGFSPDSSFSNETCVGFEAGNSTKGVSKICIGNQAGAALPDPGLPAGIVIGASALSGATPNVANNGFVAIGASVGTNAGFKFGVLIGRSAGSNIGTTTNVVCIGDAAGNNCVGDFYTCVGNSAGRNSPNTNEAVAIGHAALDGSAGGQGTIGIGYQAGLSNTNSSAKSIFLGWNAGNGNTHADVIIIGGDAAGLNATADHDIILGGSTNTTLRTAGSVIAGGVISASDSRLKLGVRPLTEALAKINTLSPVAFDWDGVALKDAGLPHLNSDLAKRHVGLIAQDVEKTFPELVEDVAGSDGEMYKFVRYDRFTGYLIGCIQELSSRLTALEKKK